MTPASVLALYTERVARAWDNQSLISVRWRGIGAYQALHAVGMLTDAEHADAVDELLDACGRRAIELAAEDSGGDAQ